MYKTVLLVFLSTSLFHACAQHGSSKKLQGTKEKKGLESTSLEVRYPVGSTIETRFSTPKEHQRTKVVSGSFANYLRRLPLKKNGSSVTYYDGTTKPNRSVYDAVIDLPIGKRDLHQCADAVMRLRAEYLYGEKKVR
jgi:hypothetical protein